jgi:hypothetical protein
MQYNNNISHHTHMQRPKVPACVERLSDYWDFMQQAESVQRGTRQAMQVTLGQVTKTYDCKDCKEKVFCINEEQ